MMQFKLIMFLRNYHLLVSCMKITFIYNLNTHNKHPKAQQSGKAFYAWHIELCDNLAPPLTNMD